MHYVRVPVKEASFFLDVDCTCSGTSLVAMPAGYAQLDLVDVASFGRKKA
jgi:hypothetical protein